LLPGDAPIGHRQPQADQVPSEKNLMGDPNGLPPVATALLSLVD
jgi:hypothetical protein